MKEFIEKLISRLENRKETVLPKENYMFGNIGLANTEGFNRGIKTTISIVNQLAEEYNNRSVNDDLISRSALIEEIWKISKDITSEWETAGVLSLVGKQPKAYNDDWIPCSEKPKCFMLSDGRLIPFLVCDNVMWHPYIAFYDGKEWRTVLEKIKPTAWKPLPAPYQPKGE